MKKLIDPEGPLQSFFAGAVNLKETLGPILYQLPPNWEPNLPQFRSFLTALPEGYSHVVEFRDARWLTEDVFQLMERRGVSHCLHDKFSMSLPHRITAPPVYIRLHGDPAPGGDYPLQALETWAKRIRAWRDNSLDVFIYFNNDIEGYAVKNARSLKSLLPLNRKETLPGTSPGPE